MINKEYKHATEIYTLPLWIAFNLNSYDLWYSTATTGPCWLEVVNCFQFEFLRSLIQHLNFTKIHSAGCELLSIWILTIFDTAVGGWCFVRHALWIAFNLNSYDLWYSWLKPATRACSVVNCFQFEFLRSLIQQVVTKVVSTPCCELLSIWILTIFDTAYAYLPVPRYRLWIAFNLNSYDLWYSQSSRYSREDIVVNCFQFEFLRSLIQLLIAIGLSFLGCELLSIWILTIFDTAFYTLFRFWYLLWIAFNLNSYDLWYSIFREEKYQRYVVNCFQFEFLRSLIQP